jgi:protein TonB
MNMAQKINIYNDEWCDILFEERNKGYGAFVLRKDTGNRHIIAILATISVFILALVLPGIVKNVLPKKQLKNVTVTTISNINLEKKVVNEKANEVIVKEYKPIAKVIKFTAPVVRPDEEVADTATIKTQNELNESRGIIGTTDVEGTTDDRDAVDPTEVNQILEDTTQTIHNFVEQMPEFPGGGYDALLLYLKKNIHYPDLARDNGSSGIVYLQFVVNTTGKISDVTVVRGFDESCEREAVRVIKNMPNWIPGKQNGTPVRVLMSVPVRFKLEN